MRAAARHADLVKALVALDDPLNAQHWLARLARRRPIPVWFWSCVAHLPVPARTLRWGIRRAIPKVLYGPGATTDPEVVAYWTQLVSRATDVAALGRDAFRYGYEALGSHRGIRVHCPTVIVHGARDRIIPVQSSRMLHQQISGSQLVILPRSGHCPQLDNPDEVTRLVVEVVRRAGDRTESA
ncbi:2-hydroxy-6-oxononadienedioate/2-hydroxy-6-oxononatrienedioate hydrolase [Mycobacterium talmoniae]|uniref:2-hydroxy-6-oxononadienedioate/2-hydroxy-6-oxononatrienedioate hydrolase n=1 Tax=Mycobacterium talmoniae TaxID=1858794 RepID=A0A2S8BHD2_9MYCO|nr:2-hydroxy-6-oxononadienedioate/2-hydroxy-6-oxononatrienedioate hydrolase [Mycobacterium talmoniae]